MGVKPPQAEKAKIAVGKPLPFSVFGADGQLLLAEGTVIESDHTRLMLLRKGVYRDTAEVQEQPLADEQGAPASANEQTVLTALRRHYGPTSIGRRFALNIATTDSDESHTAWVIGVHNRSILLTAPRRTDGSLVSVKVGQGLVCRALQMTAAFRFRSVVLKSVFEPFPQVLIEAPKHVERRTIRSRPRAAVFLPITIDSPWPIPGVIVDLSVSGGRLALEEGGVPYERGDDLRVSFKVGLIDSVFELNLGASVVSVFGASDGRHPRVHFYGIKFDTADQLTRLVLHGYVSEQLAAELNSLEHLLSAAAPVTDEPPTGTRSPA